MVKSVNDKQIITTAEVTGGRFEVYQAIKLQRKYLPLSPTLWRTILLISTTETNKYSKTIIHLSVTGVVDNYLPISWLGKYPPIFTSTLVNNC